MLVPTSVPAPPRPACVPESGVPLAADQSLFTSPPANRATVATAAGPVEIRPITALDTRSIDRFIKDLSPTARFRRFHSAVHGLTPAQLSGVVDVDHLSRESLVAVYDAKVIGLGQFITVAGQPDTVELAVVVAEDWRRVGLGRELMRMAALAAAATGHRRATAYVQAENRPVLELMRGLDMGAAFHHDGPTVEVVIPL